jgi:hypothetical protein
MGHLNWAGEPAEPSDNEVLSAGLRADVRRQAIDRITARRTLTTFPLLSITNIG